MNIIKNTLPVIALTTLISGCGSQNLKPIETVEHVDLQRFMGDWYVIANIPTFIEKGAHNAIETYRLNEDGSIATTFTFRQGSREGDHKQYNPTGFVVDEESNALWDMQFIWPFKAEYRIIYLDESYQTTIIGRSKRDYVWLMSRQPHIEAQRYDEMLSFIASQGYDIDNVQRVPQDWTLDLPQKTNTSENITEEVKVK